MIFKPEVIAFLATLQWEASAVGYFHAGRQAIDCIINRAATLDLTNAEAGGADALDDDTKRLIADTLRDWGHDQSPYGRSIVAEVLDKHGLTPYLSPTEGVFDVAVAGITLQLTLPLDHQGQPVYSPQFVLDALGEAVVTPVKATETELATR